MEIYKNYHQKIIAHINQQKQRKKLSILSIKNVNNLVQQLSKPQISLTKLKMLIKQGIPDQIPELRLIIWELLIQFLPKNTHQWEISLINYYEMYKIYIKQYINQQNFPDYPYQNRKQYPIRQEFKENYYLWQQIEKDTCRTHAQLNFFCSKTNKQIVPFFTGPRKQKFKMIYGQNLQLYQQFLNNKQKQKQTYIYDHMTRILYLYAKLNPKIKYVQGMNQLLAPIFYLLYKNKILSSQCIQSQGLFMFIMLLHDNIQLHIKQLDKSDIGVQGKMKQINEMLQIIDKDIYDHFSQLKINPYYYSFRWITLMFAQQFKLYDLNILWDFIFSYHNRSQYLKYLCIGVLLILKQQIIRSDFIEILQKLQNIDKFLYVKQIVNKCGQLIEKYKGMNFQKQLIKSKKNNYKFLEQMKNFFNDFI